MAIGGNSLSAGPHDTGSERSVVLEIRKVCSRAFYGHGEARSNLIKLIFYEHS